MAAKKASLEDSMRAALEPKERPATVTKGRLGKRQLAAYFAPEATRQLKMMAAFEDTTVQELLREALNDLFVKRGKMPIA